MINCWLLILFLCDSEVFLITSHHLAAAVHVGCELGWSVYKVIIVFVLCLNILKIKS